MSRYPTINRDIKGLLVPYRFASLANKRAVESLIREIPMLSDEDNIGTLAGVNQILVDHDYPVSVPIGDSNRWFTPAGEVDGLPDIVSDEVLVALFNSLHYMDVSRLNLLLEASGASYRYVHSYDGYSGYFHYNMKKVCNLTSADDNPERNTQMVIFMARFLERDGIDVDGIIEQIGVINKKFTNEYLEEFLTELHKHTHAADKSYNESSATKNSPLVAILIHPDDEKLPRVKLMKLC